MGDAKRGVFRQKDSFICHLFKTLSMKLISSVLLTALFSIALGTFMPWWSVAIAAFIVSFFIRLRPGIAFLAGFLGLFAGWGLLMVIRNSANDGILANRIAQILPLGGSPGLLILLSAFIGGLVGGLAALTASYLKEV